MFDKNSWIVLTIQEFLSKKTHIELNVYRFLYWNKVNYNYYPNHFCIVNDYIGKWVYRTCLNNRLTPCSTHNIMNIECNSTWTFCNTITRLVEAPATPSLAFIHCVFIRSVWDCYCVLLDSRVSPPMLWGALLQMMVICMNLILSPSLSLSHTLPVPPHFSVSSRCRECKYINDNCN